MASPVTPSQVKALLPDEGHTLCRQIKNLVHMWVLWWRYTKYKYNNDGSITQAFADEICAITCPEDVAEDGTTEG